MRSGAAWSRSERRSPSRRHGAPRANRPSARRVRAVKPPPDEPHPRQSPFRASWADVAPVFDLSPMVAASRAVGLVEALRHDALQAECAGVPEHALTVRRIHVLGEDPDGASLAIPGSDEFRGRRILDALLHASFGVESCTAMAERHAHSPDVSVAAPAWKVRS